MHSFINSFYLVVIYNPSTLFRCLGSSNEQNSHKFLPTWSLHSPTAENFNVISNSFCIKTKFYCRKRDPFQGLKLGSHLTLGNKLSKETRVLTKQEILLGKGTRVESRRVREPRRTALPRGSQLGFMVMGLVSRLSLANHSDSESFLVVQALFSQDGCQRGGFWEVVRQVVSPFDLS